MSRKAVVVGAVLLALVAIGWAFSRETVPKSVWAKAERGDLVLTVEVNGDRKSVV